MRHFFSKSNFKGSHGQSVLAVFFSIFVYTFITLEVNVIGRHLSFITGTVSILQALGILVTGFFSDLFSRRRVHFVVQLLGLLLLGCMMINRDSVILLILLALLYNPISLLRATLMDNLPHIPKVQLMALVFIMLNLPIGLYAELTQFSFFSNATSSFWAIAASMVLSFFFFFDKRDGVKGQKVHFPLKEFTYKGEKTKFIFTFWAYVVVQIIFFLVDNMAVKYVNTPLFISVISIACICGAILALFYKKTPHIAVLTVSYGLCIVIAAVPIIAIYVYGLTNINIPTHFAIFTSVTFFGLPYAYDVILSTSHANFRGLTCGLLDSIYTGVTFLNLNIANELKELGLGAVLGIVLGLFILATILQKRAEKIYE